MLIELEWAIGSMRNAQNNHFALPQAGDRRGAHQRAERVEST
jgi:hypothetical protein